MGRVLREANLVPFFYDTETSGAGVGTSLCQNTEMPKRKRAGKVSLKHRGGAAILQSKY